MPVIGWKRWFILFVGLWENLIFSGSILGWSALNYMLKQEGIFVDLCHEDLAINPVSPYPYRNYSIESSISGQLEKLPLLNSYINYSVLPIVGPSPDQEADAVNLPQALPLLSLPSSTTTLPSSSLQQQSSTFPSDSNFSMPLRQMIPHDQSVCNHVICTFDPFFTPSFHDNKAFAAQRMQGSGPHVEPGIHGGNLLQRIHCLHLGIPAWQMGTEDRSPTD